MNKTLSIALADGEKITENPRKWVRVFVNFDNRVYMEIGRVRPDGVREVPHAVRQYYIGVDGEVTFLTQVHP